MKVRDTKAIRLYGPYGELAERWIAHTPDGGIQNFKDPLELALWLDERHQRPVDLPETRRTRGHHGHRGHAGHGD